MYRRGSSEEQQTVITISLIFFSFFKSRQNIVSPVIPLGKKLLETHIQKIVNSQD